jgi:transcriptional regulator with XRE-family HTH domain
MLVLRGYRCLWQLPRSAGQRRGGGQRLPAGGASAPAVENGGTVVETDPILVFGRLLKALRERARLSQKQLGDLVYCSGSMVSAVETGAKPAKLDLVQRMDQALNACGALIAVWPITTAGTYPSWFARVAELEREAFKIHEWEVRVIPGLLQTAEYARAMMRAGRPTDDDENIERDVNARVSRQEIFSGSNPPVAWFVIDEPVLHRPIGGSSVMWKQLEKLERMSELPNIIIQVMPSDVGCHPGIEGPLRILEFLDSPPVWYTEGWYSGRMVETPRDVASAMTCFDLIKASALSPDESRRAIASIRNKKYEEPGLA